MKSFFQCCQLCGKPQTLNELETDGKGFITCKDAEPCIKRVGNQKQALLIAKREELEATNKTRNRLIDEIAALMVELGIEDAFIAENNAELARIEAE